MTGTISLICTKCGSTYPLDTRDWQCSCGALFALTPWPLFNPAQIDDEHGLWRYRKLLPVEPSWQPVTLGEGDTPLVQSEWNGHPTYLKMESLQPTGSFKDRGMAVLVTALKGLGIDRIVDESSGNAGASLAAYAARAGIMCDVCVPSDAAGPKLTQMAQHGAEVIEIKGKREYAALAAWAAAAHGAYYASHAYHPFVLAGIETLAYELWEQLGRQAPRAVVVPVGNGTLLLGVYLGFRRLQQAGLIPQAPRMYGVQAAACSPVYQAFVQDRDDVELVRAVPTLATAISIGRPLRSGQILAAVRESGGSMATVTEQEIEQACGELARQGFYVEVSAAVAVAGLPKFADLLSGKGAIVIPLTGHGLKTNQARVR